MSLRSAVLKPEASTRTEYVPGIKLGAAKAPAASDVSSREVPRSWSVTVTVAPAITPPLSSVTLPIMRPKLSCEKAGIQKARRATPKLSHAALLDHFHPLTFISPSRESALESPQCSRPPQSATRLHEQN